MTKTPRLDLIAIAMGLGFAFMWSSAFTSARILVAEAPPLLLLALRFCLSGLLALLLARAMGQSWRITAAQWRPTIVFGVCQNALYLGLMFVAMQTVPASIAAIIASTMPLLVALMSWAFLGQRPRPLALLGLAAGFLGVALILGARIGGGADLLGLLYCFIAVLGLSIATLSMRGASSGGNLMTVVGLQMLVGAGILALVGALTESWEVTWSLRVTLAFAYTTLVPGLAATFVWFLLVERIGAVRAATFHFLNPVFGVAIAAALLAEPLGLWDGVGVAITTAGILAVQLARQAR